MHTMLVKMKHKTEDYTLFDYVAIKFKRPKEVQMLVIRMIGIFRGEEEKSM